MFANRPPGNRQVDFGLGGPVPRDLLVLMGLLFLTFSLSAFATTSRLVEVLRLSPELWRQGFLWQLVTYPFVEVYANSSALWLLISLWMIYAVGKQVFFFVGRKAFWRHFFTTTLVAGAVAAVVQIALGALGWSHPMVLPFGLMTGFSVVLTFLFTGFAVLYSHATIYLMFVLPIRAGWFVGIEALLIFLGFLGTRDFAGFVGLVTVLAVSYFLFSGRSPKRFVHELRLRITRKILEAKLRRLNSKGGGRGGSGGGNDVVRGPWVN